MAAKRDLYLINEKSEELETKSSLTKVKINTLPFHELNFFSTHNSAINKCQIGCNSNMNEIKRYLKFIEFFPICIELDLIYNAKGTFVGHLTKKNMPIKEVCTSISKILKEAQTTLTKRDVTKEIYPLVIVFDNSTLYKGILQITELLNRTQDQKESLAKYMKKLLVDCKTSFEGKTVEGPISSSARLSELMNKVLFRFKDEDNEANITENMGVSKAINVGKDITTQCNTIMRELGNEAIIRTYPHMPNRTFVAKASIRKLTRGIIGIGDNGNLKQLNKAFLPHIFSRTHKINFFSFNSYSIEDPDMRKLIKKFATLYGNTILDAELVNISNPDETEEVNEEVSEEVKKEYNRALAQYKISNKRKFFEKVYNNQSEGVPSFSQVIKVITESVGGVKGGLSTFGVKETFAIETETGSVGSIQSNIDQIDQIDQIVEQIRAQDYNGKYDGKYGEINAEFVKETDEVGSGGSEELVQFWKQYRFVTRTEEIGNSKKSVTHFSGGSKKYKKKTKNKKKKKKTKNKNKKTKNKKTKNKKKKKKKKTKKKKKKINLF